MVNSTHQTKNLQKLSVVIHCFNNGTTIADTLRGVLNQTIKPSELIVVNDGSTDESKYIIKKFLVTEVKLRKIRGKINGKVNNNAEKYDTTPEKEGMMNQMTGMMNKLNKMQGKEMKNPKTMIKSKKKKLKIKMKKMKKDHDNLVQNVKVKSTDKNEKVTFIVFC